MKSNNSKRIRKRFFRNLLKITKNVIKNHLGKILVFKMKKM